MKKDEEREDGSVVPSSKREIEKHSSALIRRGIALAKVIEDEDKRLFPIKKGNKCGYIDNTGKMVIKRQFDRASNFSEGLACVTIRNRGRGFINKAGKVIIGTKFFHAHDFSEGLARVIGDEVWGYIDKTGKYIWNISYKNRTHLDIEFLFKFELHI